MRRISVHPIILSSLMALAAIFLLLPAALADGYNSHLVGHVYVLTNPQGTNAIEVFNRYSDGTLTPGETTLIGGQGTGAALGSQGSLQLSPDQQWLFAVDAGSSQISVVHVNNGHLQPFRPTSSGGVDPISLTYISLAPNLGYLYVLNADDQNNDANVTGFWFTNGALHPLPNSMRQLIQVTDQKTKQKILPVPAEVHASPDGTHLIVTEKNTNMVDSYQINPNGSLSPEKFIPSTGNTPFGFAFNPVNPQQFIVSDAASGALTSYQVQGNGQVNVLDGPVSDSQTAPCWVVILRNGKFAYTTNAGSNSISVYGVNAKSGALTLDSTTNLTAGATHPTEMSLSPDNGFLYALDTTSGNISVFGVNGDGSLSIPQGQLVTVPTSSVGIASDTQGL